MTDHDWLESAIAEISAKHAGDGVRVEVRQKGGGKWRHKAVMLATVTSEDGSCVRHEYMFRKLQGGWIGTVAGGGRASVAPEPEPEPEDVGPPDDWKERWLAEHRPKSEEDEARDWEEHWRERQEHWGGRRLALVNRAIELLRGEPFDRPGADLAFDGLGCPGILCQDYASHVGVAIWLAGKELGWADAELMAELPYKVHSHPSGSVHV